MRVAGDNGMLLVTISFVLICVNVSDAMLLRPATVIRSGDHPYGRRDKLIYLLTISIFIGVRYQATIAINKVQMSRA